MPSKGRNEDERLVVEVTRSMSRTGTTLVQCAVVVLFGLALMYNWGGLRTLVAQLLADLATSIADRLVPS